MSSPQADPAASFYGTAGAVQSWLDQNLTAYLEQNPALIQAKNILGGAAAGFCPAGVVLDYAGDGDANGNPPDGWVWCDASTYDGTNPFYLNLWNAIGTKYGGTGQSAFKVPPAEGRITVKKARSGGHADVSTIGFTESNVSGASAVAKANLRPTHSTTKGTLSGSTSSVSAGTPSGSISSFTYVQSAGGGFSLATPGADNFNNVATTPTFTGSALGTHNHTVTLSGVPGPSGTNPVDTVAYLVLNGIIKL